MSTCQHCAKPLEYKGSGRRPKFWQPVVQVEAQATAPSFQGTFRGAHPGGGGPTPSPPRAEAVRMARAKAERCRRKLDEARAACEALDAEPGPDPLEGRGLPPFTGGERLPRGRG